MTWVGARGPQVGIGAFVLNEFNEVLLVQEGAGPLKGQVGSLLLLLSDALVWVVSSWVLSHASWVLCHAHIIRSSAFLSHPAWPEVSSEFVRLDLKFSRGLCSCGFGLPRFPRSVRFHLESTEKF